MIDIKSGVLKIGKDLILSPKFTYKDFMKTPYFKGQDGVSMIYLEDKESIDDKLYIISLFFQKQKLYMVSLINCDDDIVAKEELKRKKIHDEILRKYGIESGKEYVWGRIESNYDVRSNVSSIDIFYY